MKTIIKFRNWILDLFFSKPFKYDILFATLITAIAYYLNYKRIIDINSYSNVIKIASDVGKSCITIAGFVLTILTIVVSFKNAIDSKTNIEKELKSIDKISKIDLFFSSALYFKTVKVLLQSITGLVIVFVLFLFIFLFENSLAQYFKFYATVFGLIIAILIFLRCILTLKLIIKLQMASYRTIDS